MIDRVVHIMYNVKATEILMWKGDRAAEGARLESVLTGNRHKGSNPFLSAIDRARRGVSGTLLPAIRYSGVESPYKGL